MDLITLGPRTYLATVATIILVLTAMYYAIFSLQLGANVEAEWWVKNIYSYKDHVAARTESPKILIVSGSNSLFGLDSGIISDKTVMPVVNLTGHAAMDMEFYYVKLRKYMGTGDIVVMPLEFIYLQRLKVSDWFVNNMLAWGEEDYLEELDLVSFLKFLVTVPKARVYEGLLHLHSTNPILSSAQVIKEVERTLSEDGAGWRGYTHKSLNEHGDIVSGDEITDLFKKSSRKGFFYYGGWDISDRFFRMFSKIQKLVDDHDGRLLLTWSVSMKNEKFDLSQSKYQRNITRIRENLSKGSVAIHCDPEDFHFEKELFFDTHYHLNKRGTILRSENLTRCIYEAIKPSG